MIHGTVLFVILGAFVAWVLYTTRRTHLIELAARIEAASESARISNLLLRLVVDDPKALAFETEALHEGQTLEEVVYVRSVGGLLATIGTVAEDWVGAPFLPSIPAPHREAVRQVMAGEKSLITYITPWEAPNGALLYLDVTIIRNHETGRVYGKAHDVTALESARRSARRKADHLAGAQARAEAEFARASNYERLIQKQYEDAHPG